MSKKRAANETEELAALCAKAHATLARAGRRLHDDVGPQFVGAGLLLSILKTDFPKAAATVDDVLAALNTGMESVRALSQELNASPVDRLGLKHALSRFPVELTYDTTVTLSREVASSLYEAAAAAIRAAVDGKAKRIQVSVTGKAGVRVRVADDGRSTGRAKTLMIPKLLAEASGLAVALSTGKSTIVSVSYAVRRPTGR